MPASQSRIPDSQISVLNSSVLFLFLSLSFVFSFQIRPELANQEGSSSLEEDQNKRVVRALYEALSAGDVETVHRLLAPDIEWWFHGPPASQHMMRLLTGVSESDPFDFVPVSVQAFGPTVLAEGRDPSRSASWVHAWTVTNGVITQVREYFNTSLVVTRLGNSATASSSSSSFHCLHHPLWESSLSDSSGKSMPGLVLAI